MYIYIYTHTYMLRYMLVYNIPRRYGRPRFSAQGFFAGARNLRMAFSAMAMHRVPYVYRPCILASLRNPVFPKPRFPKPGYAKLFTLLDLCVSSLRRGHANILCIVPILTDDLSMLRAKSGYANLLHGTHPGSLYRPCIHPSLGSPVRGCTSEGIRRQGIGS